MTKQHTRIRPFQCLGLILVSLVMGLSCGEEELIGPGDRSIDLAGKPGTGGPTVTATDPSGAPQDTTLDVRVLGNGYDAGSTAEFAIDEQAVPQVRTNSTTFVSSKELRANITIDADAPTELYDVIVRTSGGKRGIGIEKFAVFVTMIQIGSSGSSAWSVSTQGNVAGETIDRRGFQHVFFWSELGGMEEVGLGSVHDMSSDGRIIGKIWPDPMVWTRLGPNSWSSEALPAPAGVNTWAYGINHVGNRIAGSVDGKPAVWDRIGGNWTLTMLPVIAGEPICSALEVNDAGLIVGGTGTTGTGCVWVQQDGIWAAHLLEPPANAPEETMAGDINASGDVLGATREAGIIGRAVLWERNATGWSGPIELPLIPPGSQIGGLDDSGRIAGAYIRDGNWRAFVCCSSGFQDLGSVVGNQSLAEAIAGPYVVGSSGGNGKFRAVRWTVP